MLSGAGARRDVPWAPWGARGGGGQGAGNPQESPLGPCCLWILESVCLSLCLLTEHARQRPAL